MMMAAHYIDTPHYKSLAFLQGLPPFAHLPDAEIERFVEAAQLRNYQKGKLLYLEGHRAESFYVICNGWVKLFRTTEEGEEVILAMLTKNSVIGENAIFEHGLFTSTAQVAETAQILSLPLSILEEQLRTGNHQLAMNMLTSMVQYQRRHEMQQEQYLLYSAPQRIGCFLLELCSVQEQVDGVILNLPYDKSLIASTLGMKAATFSRALNILRGATGIQFLGTRVTIVSMARLLQFVKGCYSPPSAQD